MDIPTNELRLMLAINASLYDVDNSQRTVTKAQCLIDFLLELQQRSDLYSSLNLFKTPKPICDLKEIDCKECLYSKIYNCKIICSCK